MLEVGVVLVVYLVMVAATAWQWMRKPPAVGYYVCGVLGLVNVGFIMTSQEFLPQDKVSLVRGSVYILVIVAQVGILFIVGPKLHRTFKAHLERARLGVETAPLSEELSPFFKAIVFTAAAGGSVMVIELILTRRLFFLQPGMLWQFYVMLTGFVVLLGIGWLKYYVEKKRRQ